MASFFHYHARIHGMRGGASPPKYFTKCCSYDVVLLYQCYEFRRGVCCVGKVCFVHRGTTRVVVVILEGRNESVSCIQHGWSAMASELKVSQSNMKKVAQIMRRGKAETVEMVKGDKYIIYGVIAHKGHPGLVQLKLDYVNEKSKHTLGFLSG